MAEIPRLCSNLLTKCLHQCICEVPGSATSLFSFHKRFILEHELGGNLGNLNLCSQAIRYSYLAPEETISDPFCGESCVLD